MNATSFLQQLREWCCSFCDAWAGMSIQRPSCPEESTTLSVQNWDQLWLHCPWRDADTLVTFWGAHSEWIQKHVLMRSRWRNLYSAQTTGGPWSYQGCLQMVKVLTGCHQEEELNWDLHDLNGEDQSQGGNIPRFQLHAGMSFLIVIRPAELDRTVSRGWRRFKLWTWFLLWYDRFLNIRRAF